MRQLTPGVEVEEIVAHPIEQARQTQAASIESLTGKTMDELFGKMAQWSESKHGELVARAREEFGLTYGHANFLVHSFRQRQEPVAEHPDVDGVAQALDRMYVGSKAGQRPLHDHLMARLRELGPFEISPKKSYLSLRRGKQFATVGPGTRGRLELGLNYRGAAASERLEELPPGGMCSHRLYLSSAEEVDDELVQIVRVAYEAAG